MGTYDEIIVDGLKVVVSASLVTVIGTSIVLVSVDVTTVVESSRVVVEEGVGVAELEGTADDEALTRRGVSLLTTQLDASSV
jgi:hypothetical protein